jgi:hypothetical protein
VLLTATLIGLAGAAAPARAGKPLGVVPAAPLEPQPLTPEKDEQLLRAVCRYLKLSRTQAINILPIARWAERGAALFAKEEAGKLRELERIGDANPVLSERIKHDLEERRTQLRTQTIQTVGPQLTRILTREQIALLWRLQQGSPPKYTQPDPILLEEAGGFLGPGGRQYQLRGGLLLDLGGDVDLRHAQELTDLAIAERLSVEAAAVLARQAELRSVYARRFLQALPEDGAVRVGGPSEKPFPQLVAETTQLSDLLPVVEPFVQRAFTSERWLPVLEALVKEGELRGGSARNLNVSLGTMRLLRDYRMEFGFRDLARKGPELEPLGGDIDHGLYRFAPGQGLTLTDVGVTDHYAVQVNFRYFGGDSYQKIIDFKDGSVDGGLYLYQGHVTFYTLANGGVPVPGQEHRLRIERNRSTRAVRVFLDLQPIFAFIDLDDAAVFDKSKGILFVDDKATKGEQGPGEVRSVAVWGAAPRS